MRLCRLFIALFAGLLLSGSFLYNQVNAQSFLKTHQKQIVQQDGSPLHWIRKKLRNGLRKVGSSIRKNSLFLPIKYG